MELNDTQHSIDLMGGEENYRRFVRRLNLTIMIVIIPMLAGNIATGSLMPERLSAIGFYAFAVLLSSLCTRKNPRLAVKVLLITIWCSATYGSWTLGGIYSSHLLSYPFLIAAASWLLNRRWLLSMTGATLLVMLTLGISAETGWQPPIARSPPLLHMATVMVIISICAYLTHVAVGRALETTRQLKSVSDEMLQHSFAVAVREDETRRVMESVPAMMMVLSFPDLVIRDCNERYANPFGYTRADLVGHCVTEFRDRLPQPLPEKIALAAKGKAFSYPRAMPVPGDGPPQWMEVVIQPELRDGQLVSMYVCCLDITERIAAEERIRQLNEQLAAKVEVRTMELSETRAQLSTLQDDLAQAEAKATISALVASVSHELGTPLGNGVMTATTLAEQTRTFAKQIASGQLKRSVLDAYLASANYGTDLLLRNMERARDLLQKFKQVAADQASEQRRQFDLAIMVTEVLATLAPSLKSKPQKIDVQIPEGIFLDSYPGPLGQVVINLVNNAYLHAFEGRADGNLSITAVADATEVHLSFSDDGNGMSAETLNHLFKPFFSTKIGRGGTGLGMAIVDGIVRKTLGGSLNVDSEPGRGTRFDITLPRIAPGP